MSDHWIVLIPEDPQFLPDREKQRRARERFAQIAPGADKIELTVSDSVQYFDCGANAESIRCPSCGSEIPATWWQDRMSEDYSRDGFQLALFPTPCCGKQYTLNDLMYEWPQGFSRFALDAMNPNIGKLADQYKGELEEILGINLRVIYKHI